MPVILAIEFFGGLAYCLLFYAGIQILIFTFKDLTR